MKRTIKRLAVVLAAMVLSLSCGGSYADSLYVSDQIQNTVSQFDAVTGTFQRVLITAAAGGMHGPNGIIVNPVASPQIVVANQNVGLPVNGDIRVFDEGSGALKFILVPD